MVRAQPPLGGATALPPRRIRGARPLRRIIRRYLREPLADYLLEADPQPGAKVFVDVEGAGLTFQRS